MCATPDIRIRGSFAFETSVNRDMKIVFVGAYERLMYNLNTNVNMQLRNSALALNSLSIRP